MDQGLPVKQLPASLTALWPPLSVWVELKLAVSGNQWPILSHVTYKKCAEILPILSHDNCTNSYAIYIIFTTLQPVFSAFYGMHNESKKNLNLALFLPTTISISVLLYHYLVKQPPQLANNTSFCLRALILSSLIL